jgi:hypothetical protein
MIQVEPEFSWSFQNVSLPNHPSVERFLKNGDSIKMIFCG